MRRQRCLDPCPDRPATPRRKLAFHGAAGDTGGVVAELRAGQVILCPGIAGSPVIEPAVEGVADAGAYRAGHFQEIAVGRRADRRRRQGAKAEYVAGKRYVGLDTEQQARLEESIVAGLEAAEIAALAGEKIIGAEQIERAGDVGGPAGLCRREVGPRRCKADMAADVKARPVVARCGSGQGWKVGGTGATANQQRRRGDAGAQAGRRSR